MAGLTVKSGLMELGMLATGCLNTILIKAADNTYSRGWGGDEHKFEHPWTQSLFMFWAETLCLATFVGMTLAPRRGKASKGPEGGDAAAEERPRMRFFQMFPPILVIPMSLDLLGTSISSIGLLYVSASVWQMLRGSIIVFSCILSRIVLRKKTPAYRWFAVSFTIAGLILVGLSSILTTRSHSSSHAAAGSGSGSSAEAEGAASDEAGWKTVVGIVLVLFAMMLMAAHAVVQELLLRKNDFKPLQMIGMEGFCGMLVMTFVVLPITYFIPGSNPSSLSGGSYDNAIDAFIMMGHSAPLLVFILVYIVSDAFYNFFGVNVTKYLSAVHRTIIDACRSVFVWAWQLLTYYCINKRYGEKWTKYSGLQVAGFVLLIIGTVIYNGIVRLPFFEYEEPKKENQTPETAESGYSSSTAAKRDAELELDTVEVGESANDSAELKSSV